MITWTRSIPLRYEADVAVVGGGIAGVCAACAAARSGASVILVERFGVTGGVLTSGGVANFSGETEGQGEVFDQIVAGLGAFGAIEPKRSEFMGASGRVFDHEILALVLQEMVLRRGVKLLLHTRFVDANVSDRGRIKEAIVCGPSGPEALRARQWIDCTGEAHVAHQAGFRTLKGRPADGLQLPMSVMGFVREVKGPLQPQVPSGWFPEIRSPEDLPMVSVWPNGPGGKALKIKVPMFDATDTEQMTAAEIAARRKLMAVLDYYQRAEHMPWRYDRCSPIVGIREGRRIVGDYILTVGDVRAGRAFADGVACGSYPLDGHKPDDDKRTYILPPEARIVPPYQIPLRALYARDGLNLWMAGRCFSSDQLALSSARVSTSGSMMGQAAGIGAALAVQQRCEIRDLDPQDVRRTVEARGANLDI